jgi:ComF family protein
MRDRSLLQGLLDLIAPRRCAGCDMAAREDGAAFCEACAPLIEPVPEAFRPPRPAAAAFAYGGPLADAIARMKYARRPDLARPLGALLAGAACRYAGRVDCVMPLPLHAARLRERGFNQSALLAAAVARSLGLPLDTRRLRRVRRTADQAGLSRALRAENVRAAFAVRARMPGTRVLLIDDVRTTGATLAEASRALLEAGCAEVRTLALARADA